MTQTVNSQKENVSTTAEQADVHKITTHLNAIFDIAIPSFRRLKIKLEPYEEIIYTLSIEYKNHLINYIYSRGNGKYTREELSQLILGVES